MKTGFLMLAAAVLATLPVRAQDANIDAGYDPRFGYPGLGLFVYAAAAGETGVYLGGSFDEVAKLEMEGLTRFDGKRFHGMGVSGTVRALAPAGGMVYVGGSFAVDAAGGVRARGIAVWDERSRVWRTLGSGAGPLTADRRAASIRAIAVAGSSVYVAGNFATIDGVAAAGLARWNGSAWTAMARRVGDSSTDAVYALAALGDGRVLVGGKFDEITALDGSRVRMRSPAAYDPASNRWTSFAGGLGGDFFSAEVAALAVDGPRVYVGGEFIEAGTVAASHVALWDGARWSALGGGVEEDGYVEALAVHQGILYIGGGFARVGSIRAFNVARWDGSRWFGLGGTDDSVTGLAVFDGELYLVGDFEEAGDVSVESAARWSIESGNWRGLGDGAAWLSLTGEINAVATDASGRIYVGGNFTHIGGREIADLAMWDGRQWQPLGSGVNDLVNDLLIAGDQLYVGGAFTQAGGRTAGGIARWNTATGEWSSLGAGVNRSVFTLAAAPDGVIYVGGHFSSAGGADARNLAIFDPGTNTWRKSPFDFPVAVIGGCYCVRALQADAEGVFVGGTFPYVEANGRRVEAQSLFYWNRAANELVVLASGLTYNTGNLDVTGSVHALHLDRGQLYVGGHFDKVGGVGARHLARFSGGGWQPLAEGLAHTDRLVDPAALAFVQMDTRLLVVGRFTSAGAAPSRHAALWDKARQEWLPFGYGFEGVGDEQVNDAALAPDGAVLFGGEFVLAGGTPAASFARWKPAGEAAGGGKGPITESGVAPLRHKPARPSAAAAGN